MLSIVRVRPLVWFRALFVHGGVCDVMMTTYCLPIHTQNGGRAHKGGGPVSAPRHRSRPRGRGRGRYRYRYRSIDRSIARVGGWVRAWCGFRMGFAFLGFACPNDVHPPIDVTRVGTARRIGAMSGAPSTSSAAMQAKLVRGR